MYFLAILTLMYFFYVILFYEDVFLNFLNRQCIYSMLFEFTKIYFNLPLMYFFGAIFYTDMFFGCHAETVRCLKTV